MKKLRTCIDWFTVLCVVWLTFSNSVAIGQAPYNHYGYMPAPQSSSAVRASYPTTGDSTQGISWQDRAGESMQQGLSPVPASSAQAGFASYPSSTNQPYSEVSDPTEERAGLLGSSYLDAQYVFLTAPTSIEYANPFHGVRGTVNTPILWGEDVAKYFSQDVFFSARHLGMTADIPGTFPPAELDVDWNTWAIGTTLFADVTPSFRPFIQLGYVRSDISVEGKSAVAFMEIEDSQDALLVNVGSEFDLTDNLAARIALEIDAPDFGGSFFTVEQIYWCTPNVFLRGGVIGDVDATTIGAVIGGGVAF